MSRSATPRAPSSTPFVPLPSLPEESLRASILSALPAGRMTIVRSAPGGQASWARLGATPVPTVSIGETRQELRCGGLVVSIRLLLPGSRWERQGFSWRLSPAQPGRSSQPAGYVGGRSAAPLRRRDLPQRRLATKVDAAISHRRRGRKRARQFVLCDDLRLTIGGDQKRRPLQVGSQERGAHE